MMAGRVWPAAVRDRSVLRSYALQERDDETQAAYVWERVVSSPMHQPEDNGSGERRGRKRHDQASRHHPT